MIPSEIVFNGLKGTVDSIRKKGNYITAIPNIHSHKETVNYEPLKLNSESQTVSLHRFI